MRMIKNIRIFDLTKPTPEEIQAMEIARIVAEEIVLFLSEHKDTKTAMGLISPALLQLEARYATRN
jgi:hypothetical protein